METRDKSKLNRDIDRNPDLARDDERHQDRNPDAITGEPGSHPVGTGIGAAGVGAAGAAIGSLLPGVGTLVGGVVGAIVGAVGGAYAGRGVAEAVNPTDEDAYWYDHYASRSYVRSGSPYDLYRPAYQYGWESRTRLPREKTFDQVEPELKRGWESSEYCDALSWEEASPACRDAWERAEKGLAPE